MQALKVSFFTLAPGAIKVYSTANTIVNFSFYPDFNVNSMKIILPPVKGLTFLTSHARTNGQYHKTTEKLNQLNPSLFSRANVPFFIAPLHSHIKLTVPKKYYASPTFLLVIMISSSVVFQTEKVKKIIITVITITMETRRLKYNKRSIYSV